MRPPPTSICSYATRGEDQTTLAFVRIVAGESHYAFYDAATAARNWTYPTGRIPFATIDAVHVGSTTLVHDQGAAETLAMIADASRSATISFDPNCRPNLVKDRDAYRARMDGFAANADMIKMSDVDFDYLHGHDRYAERAEALLAAGCKPVRRHPGSERCAGLALHRRRCRDCCTCDQRGRHDRRRRQFPGGAAVRPAQAGPARQGRTADNDGRPSCAAHCPLRPPALR